MERARIRITGRVQGVFFRATARERANALDLKGWIRNNPDRSVESVVEGKKEDIETYIQWCHQGSSAARVDQVSVNWEEYRKEFDDFSIKRY